MAKKYPSRALYQVQRTTNLINPQWQNIGAPIAGYTFTGLMEGETAFSRVMVIPP